MADPPHPRPLPLHPPHRPRRACSQLKQCLRSDPEYKPCLQLRRTLKTVLAALEEGNQLVQANRWAQAVKHYETVTQGPLAADKKLPRQRQQALHNLCTAYLKTSAAPKALTTCTQAIELDASDWEAFVNRAEAHIQSESYDDGAALAQRAQRAQRGCAGLMLKRRSCGIELDRFTAVRDFQKANELNRNNRVVRRRRESRLCNHTRSRPPHARPDARPTLACAHDTDRRGPPARRKARSERAARGLLQGPGREPQRLQGRDQERCAPATPAPPATHPRPRNPYTARDAPPPC